MEHEAYVYFLFFAVFAAVLYLTGRGVWFFLRSRVRNERLAVQDEPYAGGFSELSSFEKKFNADFFLPAVLFFILSVFLTVLLLWSVNARATGSVGLFHAWLFFCFCAVACAYAYKKGALR